MSHYTITFGENAENHVGMQQLGKRGEYGFELSTIELAMRNFKNSGCEVELVKIHDALPLDMREQAEKAYILVIRKGVDALVSDIKKTHVDAYNEQKGIEYDTKAIMYGRLVNKKLRHNVCFSEQYQAPDLASGKGTVIAYKDVPVLSHIRSRLPEFFGEEARDLYGEGNYYYDVKKCGIGFHGDTERKKIISVKLGAKMPLHYQWYYKGAPVGDRVKLMIGEGDMYIMSTKASGFDWKKKNILTIRHAAGTVCVEDEKPKSKTKTAAKTELQTDIENVLDKCIIPFIQKTSAKYNIPEAALLKLWK